MAVTTINKCAFFGLIAFLSCGGVIPNEKRRTTKGGLSAAQRIVKTDVEWKALLTAEQYYILRQGGTERAFTGKYHDHHERGTYLCAACRLPLFSSATKFDSGTGWPSFYAPIKPEHVEELPDFSHGMVRTEVRCGRCGGHLGHVFSDGPGGPGSGAGRMPSVRTTDGPGGPGSGAGRMPSVRTTDGPGGPGSGAGAQPTGLRYCINSAALEFLRE